jgi:hypothetical protein
MRRRLGDPPQFVNDVVDILPSGIGIFTQALSDEAV